jgi:large subunit ribosomal protein L14
MIFVESIIDIADNSGGKQGKCIRILTPISLICRRPGVLGNYILLTLRKIILLKKVKKGSIYKGLIIRTLKIVERAIGYLKFDKNAVVLLNKKNEPLGSRVKGIIGKEVRETKNSKVVTLALGLL